MHAEPGGGVDLADPAADRAIALGDVGGQKIDAADVEPDRAHGTHRHVAVVRMNDVGDIGRGAASREVRGLAEVHDLPRGRYRPRLQARACQHLLRLRIELEPRQDLLVADSAARILVDDVDQLHDGVRAVADNVARACAASPPPARR